MILLFLSRNMLMTDFATLQAASSEREEHHNASMLCSVGINASKEGRYDRTLASLDLMHWVRDARSFPIVCLPRCFAVRNWVLLYDSSTALSSPPHFTTLAHRPDCNGGLCARLINTIWPGVDSEFGGAEQAAQGTARQGRLWLARGSESRVSYGGTFTLLYKIGRLG